MLCLRLRASLVCALVGSLAASLLETDDAWACGGCFHSPPPAQVVIDSSLVTAHRMALSISPAQTVLWDQIRYSGSPTEFAWVLPVRAGARIELSTDAWMAALDASTQTIITGPTPACGGAAPTQREGSGGGCGSSFGSSALYANGAADDAGASTPAVEVISQSVVGPYDSVTVRASQGQALDAWLVQNGYDVPSSLLPTIGAYTTAGFDFIALKLQPGQGVQAMQPVRVVSPGADPTLPLRMVAAGIGSHVGLELYVLSEGRYHTQNFPDATIDFTRLAWDPYNDISTYSTLAGNALAAGGGAGWLTEFSGRADLGGFSVAPNPGLRLAYTTTCVPSFPACGGGTDAGPGDAAPAAPASMCTQVLSCDDLDVAMNGIAAGALWVTRLRADLPAGALATDLVIEATASQAPVSNLHTTEKYTDPKYNPCAGAAPAKPAAASSSPGCATTQPPAARYRGAVELSLGGALMALVLRRRRRP
jgi:hypothetical protein